MIRLVSEIEQNDELLSYDYLPTIQEAIRLAERGFLDVKLSLPDKRKLSVKQIVNRWKLHRYLKEAIL